MRLNGLITKANAYGVAGLESYGNYTYVYFKDGGRAFSSYTKCVLKEKLAAAGVDMGLVEVNRGKEAHPEVFKLTKGAKMVSATWVTSRDGNTAKGYSVLMPVSRRKMDNVVRVFRFLVLILLLASTGSATVFGQITALNDTLTGCKSTFSSEWLLPLMNDTDSRNEVEVDSAVFVYPVYEESFIDSVRNVSGGDVTLDTVNRQRLRVRWTDGVTLVDSLTFEYRVADTVGTTVYSNWALVILTGKVPAVATAGSYGNTTHTVINGCRMLNRGKTVFENNSDYELKVTNGATFGPGTEFKAGSVVEILVDE